MARRHQRHDSPLNPREVLAALATCRGAMIALHLLPEAYQRRLQRGLGRRRGNRCLRLAAYGRRQAFRHQALVVMRGEEG